MSLYAILHDPRISGADFEPDDDHAECGVCGAWLEWETCYQCFGQGEFDLYEQNPTEYEPGEVEMCDVCHGDGGYLECPALPHSQEVKPL